MSNDNGNNKKEVKPEMKVGAIVFVVEKKISLENGKPVEVVKKRKYRVIAPETKAAKEIIEKGFTLVESLGKTPKQDFARNENVELAPVRPGKVERTAAYFAKRLGKMDNSQIVAVIQQLADKFGVKLEK